MDKGNDDIGRIKLNESLKQILRLLAVGTIKFNANFSYSYAARREWQKIYLRFDANTRSKRQRLREKITFLQQNNIIYLNDNECKLTDAGKKLLETLELHEIQIKQPNKWDGLWRLVSYDIPDQNKIIRNNFRNILKNWGFLLVQRSLWVLPWDCQDEVSAVAHSYKIEPYVIYLTSKDLPMSNRLKKHFNL